MVIPCYNEEEVLPETARQLLEKMQSLMTAGKITEKSRIVFVNDGSKDRTWELIQKFHAENPIYQGISLSRNRGHQNALLAGLMTVKKHCDMTISLDADLQDDIDAIDQMIAKYEAGNDIVYGVRSARKTDTLFKKYTAEGFYKVMKHMGADLVFNHADYRLMSRRALDGLESFKEVNMFLRGVVPLIGYPSDKVYYARKERLAGTSKYPLKKMLLLCVGRDHVPFHQAYYFDYPSGHADLSGEYRHADLFCSAALYGSHYYRMDFADRVDLGDRRVTASGDRRDRAVHRKGVSGNQGTPEIYCRNLSLR